MLSFNKILVLAAILAAIWYGLKLLGNYERARQQVRRSQAKASRTADRRITTEDLVKCRVCGTYVSARDPGRCGRGDCAFPG